MKRSIALLATIVAVLVGSLGHGVLDTSSAEAEVTEVTGSTTATNVAAVTGITASTANPAGGVASIDNRPAFVRVIFCKAN